MKTTKMLTILVLVFGLIVCWAKVSEAAPMGTAFTYQGRLIDANSAADGEYDFQFELYDANVAGSQQGSTIDVNELDVIDGDFTVELDFGSGVFDGNARWLEIGVRPGELDDPNVYTTLSPRQEVTPTPYALYAKTAQTASSDNDWMVSDSNMYSIPSGNVGIGTNDPDSAKLYVKGDDVRFGVYGEGGTGVKGVSNILVGTGIIGEGGHAGVAGYSGYAGVLGEGYRAIYGVGTGNGWAGYFEGNGYFSGKVGIGTTDPNEKLHVAGNIKMEGDLFVDGNDAAFRGTIGPNNGAPFPRPAYDSGWVPGTGADIIFFHNIGGNVENYVVDVQDKYPDYGIAGSTSVYHNLSTDSVTVWGYPDEIRVRIWVYN